MKVLVFHLQNVPVERLKVENVSLGSDLLEFLRVVAARDVYGHYFFLFRGFR
jgi:hypothetical protein